MFCAIDSIVSTFVVIVVCDDVNKAYLCRSDIYFYKRYCHECFVPLAVLLLLLLSLSFLIMLTGHICIVLISIYGGILNNHVNDI